MTDGAHGIDADREWDLWVSWLGETPGGPSIWDDVVAMMTARQVWDGFGILYNNAPAEAHRNATFASWVKDNYVGRQAMAIRRQRDIHDDVVSIARLIDRVRQYPFVLSCQHYIDRTHGWQSEQEARRLFGEMVGAGREHIDKNSAKADLARLRTRTAVVERFTTNELAHYNEKKGTFAQGLTMADLHGSIDLIIDLSVKYREMILGSSMSRQVSMYPWTHVLSVPWISDDQQASRVENRIRRLGDKRASGEPVVDEDFF
jgi:hypothetical protein